MVAKVQDCPRLTRPGACPSPAVDVSVPSQTWSLNVDTCKTHELVDISGNDFGNMEKQEQTTANRRVI